MGMVLIVASTALFSWPYVITMPHEVFALTLPRSARRVRRYGQFARFVRSQELSFFRCGQRNHPRRAPNSRTVSHVVLVALLRGKVL